MPYDGLIAKRLALKNNYATIITDLILPGLNGYELSLDAKSVTRDGQPIELTAREFALLEFLMRNQGRVLSKPAAEHVWDSNFDTGTNVVEVYINYLRKKSTKDSLKD